MLGRTVIAAATATLALALPAAASACNNPAGNLDGGIPDGLGAGEPVPFVIGNIDEGASWTVTLDNQTIASGVDNDGRPRYHGSFPMPKLDGPSRNLDFTVTVDHVDARQDHDSGSWPSTVTVRYRAPGSGSPAPSPQSIEQPASPQPGAERVPSRGIRAPGGSQPTGIGGSVPVGGTGGVPPAGPPGPGGGPPTPSSPGGPSGGPAGSAGTSVTPATEGLSGESATERATSAEASRPEHATDAARRPLRLEAPAARRDPPDGSGRTVLLLIALTGAGLAAALALRWRRGGSGTVSGRALPPAPSDPAVEAELQEILAEERAKVEHARGERPPAELAAARDDPG
jgi:hypothetical protein